MKLKWSKYILCDKGNKCYDLAYELFDVRKLFNFGKYFCDATIRKLKNDFWKDAVKAYMELIAKSILTVGIPF